MTTVLTGYQPDPTKNLDLEPPISERISNLLAEVGQFLYETSGNYPSPDAPELVFVSRIENALCCKFTLPAHPRDMTDAQQYRELGRALLALVEHYPVSPDMLRALFGQGNVLDAACNAQASALQDAMRALFNAGLGSQAHVDLYALYHDLGGNTQ